MQYLFLIIFFVATSIHLYASWQTNQELRNKSKPLIVLSLIGYYCFATKRIDITVILALFFSWVGDILLMGKTPKSFSLGGGSFLLSHLFFILSYIQYTNFSNVPKYLFVILPIFFISAVLIIFKYLKPYLTQKEFKPMMFYLFINGMMNCFAWFMAFSRIGGIAWITAIGAFSFFVADTILFFVRFDKNSPIKTHFSVMFFYSLAQFLIVLGLVLA